MSICFMKFFSNVTTLSTMLPWMILLLIHKPDLYKLKAKRKALHFRAVSGTYFRKVVRPLPQTRTMLLCLCQTYDPETPVTAERSNDSGLPSPELCLPACAWRADPGQQQSPAEPLAPSTLWDGAEAQEHK